MKIVPFPVSDFTRENCSITPRLVPLESAYSILSRFAVANVISGATVASMFRNKCTKFSVSRTNSLSSLYSINIGAFEQELGLAKKEVYDLFLTPNYLCDHWSICSFLRYCPICMSQGIHYAIFQFDKVTKCPAHKLPLTMACHLCGAVTPFTLTSKTFRTPFGCANCRGSLLYGDYRMSSSSLRRGSGMPPEGERIYKTLGAVAGRRLSIPLLRASRVRATEVVPAMQLESECRGDEERFFSDVVRTLAEPPRARLLQLVHRSRRCSLDLPHPHEMGGEEFDLLIDELAAVLKAVIRRMCFIGGVPPKVLAWVSESSLLEGTIHALAKKMEEVVVLAQWRRLWCVPSHSQGQLNGRAAIGYVVCSWLGRFFSECREVSLTSEERSWLAKHVFADEVVRALDEFRQQRIQSGAEAEGVIPSGTAFVSPCWAVEVTADDRGLRLVTYLRQAA